MLLRKSTWDNYFILHCCVCEQTNTFRYKFSAGNLCTCENYKYRMWFDIARDWCGRPGLIYQRAMKTSRIDTLTEPGNRLYTRLKTEIHVSLSFSINMYLEAEQSMSHFDNFKRARLFTKCHADRFKFNSFFSRVTAALFLLYNRHKRDELSEVSEVVKPPLYCPDNDNNMTIYKTP